MVDGASPANIKGQVAKAILVMAFKGMEVEDIEARVSELERAAEDVKATSR
jgi:hypothetical protein